MELVALKKVDDDGLALHVGFLSNISVCCGAGAASAPLLPSPLRLGVSCRATCLKPYAFLEGGALPSQPLLSIRAPSISTAMERLTWVFPA